MSHHNFEPLVSVTDPSKNSTNEGELSLKIIKMWYAVGGKSNRGSILLAELGIKHFRVIALIILQLVTLEIFEIFYLNFLNYDTELLTSRWKNKFLEKEKKIEKKR